MIDLKVYDQYGMHYREQLTPCGWVVVDEYTPSITITPWDYYGQLWYNPLLRVLAKHKIKTHLLTTTKCILHPRGTGPYGSVRFGDDMCPSDYRIAVEKANQGKALLAIARHNFAVKQWLDGKGAMPEECRK